MPSAVRRQTGRDFTTEGTENTEKGPATRRVNLVATRTEGVAQRLDVAAQGNHCEPQEQRTCRDELGGDRRVFPGPQTLDSIENARQVERRRIQSQQQEAQHLEPKSATVDVILGQAYKG